MKEFIYYNNLFDIYGDLLTSNEQESFKSYYHEDLSLGEIASYRDVSRSAVHKTLKNVLDKLEYYEDKLHIFENKNILRNALDTDDLKDVVKRLLDE